MTALISRKNKIKYPIKRIIQPASWTFSIKTGPGEREILLDGMDNPLQVVKFGAYRRFPFIKVKLVADGGEEFGGVPITDQQQVLVGVLEIEGNFKPVRDDAAQGGAGGFDA